MKVLLDESLPRQLARELIPHEVWTVVQMGWSGVLNGALLAKAAEQGFKVFLTADRNLQYQQHLPDIGVGIVVLRAYNNRIETLQPLVPAALDAIMHVQPGVVVRVGG